MNEKQLLYIGNVKIPTNKAHGVHMIKMCEAFASAGLSVTLVAAMRFSSLKDDPYEYYGVKRNFKIKRIFSIDAIHLIPFLGFWIQFLSFSLFAAFRYLFSSRKRIYIHTREYPVAVLFKLLGFKVTYEAHRVVSKKNLYFRLVSHMDAIVTNSHGVASEFTERGFKKVLVAPNAVTLADFDISKTKEDLRLELGLPLDRSLVLYTGHLYAWKGVDTMVRAASLLTQGADIICVGGMDDDVARYRKEIARRGLTNIHFLGHVRNGFVPKYLKAADVLVLPNSAISQESVKYTSPMKLFEYMASGVPIVASDLPSIREILNERTAVFFTPDDAASLAEKLQELLKDSVRAQSISKRAHSEVQQYSWDNRAKRIIEFAGYII